MFTRRPAAGAPAPAVNSMHADPAETGGTASPGPATRARHAESACGPSHHAIAMHAPRRAISITRLERRSTSCFPIREVARWLT